MECPKCGSPNITHSHKRGIEKILQYVYPRTPYRCKECWTRFWKFQNPLSGLFSKLAIALVILLLIGAGVWYFGPFRNNGASSSEPDSRPIAKKPGKPIRRPIEMPPVEKPSTPESGGIDEKKGKDQEDMYADIKDLTREEEKLYDTEPPKPETGELKEEFSEAHKVPAPELVVVPEKPKDKEESRVIGKVTDQTPHEKSEAEPANLPKSDSEKTRRRGPLRIKDIRSETASGVFRMILVSDGPVDEYKEFTLSPPPKLVLDILGKWEYPGKPTIWVKSDLVRRIRIGEHSDKIRLVLDLKGKKTLEPVIEKTSEGLMLTIKK